jgi:hypothetical protein
MWCGSRDVRPRSDGRVPHPSRDPLRRTTTPRTAQHRDRRECDPPRDHLRVTKTGFASGTAAARDSQVGSSWHSRLPCSTARLSSWGWYPSGIELVELLLTNCRNYEFVINSSLFRAHLHNPDVPDAQKALEAVPLIVCFSLRRVDGTDGTMGDDLGEPCVYCSRVQG